MSLSLNKSLGVISESETLRISSLVKEMERRGRRVIDFTAGELGFPTPQNIARATAKKLNENKYTPALGLTELRALLAKKFNKKYKTKYSREECAVTSGAKTGLFFVFGALLNPGDEVIVPSPAWVSYEHAVRLWGGKPVFVALTEDYDLDVTAILRNINNKTKAIILNYPHNPTGKIFSFDKLKELARALKNKNIYLIHDAIYDDLVYNNKYKSLFSLVNREKLIFVHGLSKSHALTGWRVGFILAPEKIINAIKKIQSHASGNVSRPAQYAALAALSGPAPRFLKILKERRKAVSSILSEIPKIKYIIPDGAFYYFVDIRTVDKNSSRFCQELLREEGVAVVPGDAFHARGFIRISFASSDLKNIREGLRRLKNFIKKKA